MRTRPRLGDRQHWPPKLPAGTIDERVRRYIAGEPVARIAQDHGVTIPAVLHTVKRHAPNCYGRRA